jgi:uridylate kinase
MGMLATVINALALADALRKLGVPVQVMSAIGAGPLCETFQREQAIRYLEAGHAVIFAAGTGNPLFTTDSAASLRAIEIGADLLLKATKVDGVYSADPMTDVRAERYRRISYDEVLQRELGVMDLTAVLLCRDHGMDLIVFNLNKPGALQRVLSGEDEGTVVGRGLPA